MNNEALLLEAAACALELLMDDGRDLTFAIGRRERAMDLAKTLRAAAASERAAVEEKYPQRKADYQAPERTVR